VALTLIGTGHVLQIDAAIRDAILAIRPEVVAVELDNGRLRALLDRRAGRPMPPARGFIAKKLQAFQEQMALHYGTQSGAEMLAAVDAARTIGARILLIDRPINETMRRAIKEITWREKFRGAGMFLKNGAKALWNRPTSADMEEEVNRVLHDPSAALAEMGKDFPSLMRVVIEERDEIMARAIQDLENVVAVVGDGHVPGMAERLALQLPVVYRLADVQAGRLPKPDSYSFGFTVST